MWVTCYADASWSKRTGGAWAVWLRSDLGRVVRRGRCPDYVHGSAQAEIAAIYAGVFLAVKAWGEAVGHILVCSDCMSALDAIAKDAKPSRDKGTRRLQQRLWDLVESVGVELKTRWVKAHQAASVSTSAYLNVQCDKLANDERRTRSAKRGKKRRRRRRRRGPATASSPSANG